MDLNFHSTQLRLVLIGMLLLFQCPDAVSKRFLAEHSITGNLNDPEVFMTMDMDGDGDLDLVTTSNTAGEHKIIWYENHNAQANYSTEIIIKVTNARVTDLISADVDQDGDGDLLAAMASENKIVWFEHLTTGVFGAAQTISTTASDVSVLAATDLDGDGNMDILSTSRGNGELRWYENTNALGQFSDPRLITDHGSSLTDVCTADLDGDGDMDVITSAYSNDTIAWYENLDGQGSFGPQRTLTTLANGAECVTTADLDNDGDLDVLSASSRDNKIAYYTNLDGLGNFDIQRIVFALAQGAESVFTADIDEDGDMDVLSASRWDNTVAWYENLDDETYFGLQQIISTNTPGASLVLCADVDGDGHSDVLTLGYDVSQIGLYSNSSGDGTFATHQTIPNMVDYPNAVISADLDGDGDMDLLSASSSDDKIAWYENIPGEARFGVQRIITTAVNNVQSIITADLDGDGDWDVLSASAGDDKIAWYENTDGAGSFGPQQIIWNTAFNAKSVFAADLDGDGDTDVLSASAGDDKIAWYENLDGQGSFGNQRVITDDAQGAVCVVGADVDNDGDIDVISASTGDRRISWYANLGSNGNFGSHQNITTYECCLESILCADIDGDGYPDVVAASSDWNNDKLMWYRNGNGNGYFEPRRMISRSISSIRHIFSADLDNDGDLDILSASGGDGKIAWYQNTNGYFGTQQIVIEEAWGARAVSAVDLDGDGDPEVLAAITNGDRISWFENINIVVRIRSQGPNVILDWPPVPTAVQYHIYRLQDKNEALSTANYLASSSTNSYADRIIPTTEPVFYRVLAVLEND